MPYRGMTALTARITGWNLRIMMRVFLALYLEDDMTPSCGINSAIVAAENTSSSRR
jgi:hypothetical protein